MLLNRKNDGMNRFPFIFLVVERGTERNNANEREKNIKFYIKMHVPCCIKYENIRTSNDERHTQESYDRKHQLTHKFTVKPETNVFVRKNNK